ncbi:MAG TPA: ABC transporter ATP-binding protein [Candidatus Marinimicrobia bacterium]|jgi:ABC-2 type transport system ATP-binding protein|nr:ABC transporter ATP-binding protein [Candidatus Neomarinimicrobiota bacterium]HIB02292.1 ABC transporter ATP-binding protein [Candidatus Neomarinimicrobiota bacterium]HIB69939.1 ABC transporter ATP-binding protein [Candidatus Neomarinimicrobiota bacterium]HIB96495.1 ABC transporter ATP-binding protein [Candidatus Neomarinimicrobiota bacterium]HIN61946.1 ABC transporter ATP-binding protein [Candidatus Neomarinimicrobiota bacterium]
MEASVSLKKIGKILNGRSVLAGLSFGIERGSIMAVVGPNDSGKSALLKVIAGFSKPEYGSVFIDGKDVQLRRTETASVVGYMPQEVNFDPQLTIFENFQFHGRLYGMPSQRMNNRIASLSERLGFREFIHDFPHELSSGFLRRALLARTFLPDPHVLLLEEPTASLDLRSQYEVWDFLQEMRGSKTIIYTTHSIREAERVHDRLVIMDHGKVALDGTLDRLLENAGELFHFQIHFKKLPKELYKNMSKVTTVVSPSQIGEVFDFYARERKVFFDIMELAIQEELLDYAADKVGLETLIMTSTEEQLR